MAPKYVLTYFPTTGMGEPIRFLLALGKYNWKDNRLDRRQWPTIKANLPFGKVPILEYKGICYAQSCAICRYLARDIGILGKSSLDKLNADIIVDTISDLRYPLSEYYYDTDSWGRGRQKEVIQQEVVPYYLMRFEAIVRENSGTFVRGQLTWADVYFAAICDYLQTMSDMDFFQNGRYPLLKVLIDRVRSLQPIAEYIRTRPRNA